MEWLDLLYPVIAMGLTYLIGKVQEKPGYKKPKNVLGLLHEALEDDVLTADEIRAIVDAVQAKKQ